MKTSRATFIETGNVEEDEFFVNFHKALAKQPAPSKITDLKWREVIDEELVDYIIGDVREEIVKMAMSLIYTKYLEKQSYSFVVHCSHLAWIQLFDWMNLNYDPGQDFTPANDGWKSDSVKEPIKSSNWTCRNVEVFRKPVMLDAAKPTDTKSYDTICLQEKRDLKVEDLFRSSSYPSSQSFPATEVESGTKQEIARESATESVGTKKESKTDSERLSEHSIFSRLITMPWKDLPMPKFMRYPHTAESICQQRVQKLSGDNTAVLKKINIEDLPTSRVDIGYKIIPDRNAWKIRPKESSIEDQRKSRHSKLSSA